MDADEKRGTKKKRRASTRDFLSFLCPSVFICGWFSVKIGAMKIAYYAANVQGFTWIKPIHDLTGGTLCTDRETTFQAARQLWPDAEIKFFSSSKKLSLRRSRGSGKTSLSAREEHVQLAEIARELQPDIIVTTANFPHYIRRKGLAAWRQGGSFSGVKQVQVFHGISSKNNKFKPFMANYDALFFVGKRDFERFQKIGVTEKTHCELIGLPRADKILRGEKTRARVLAELSLNDAPTILYAPTHGALSSFFSWGETLVKSLPESCNVVIKPHPLIARAVASGEGDATAFQALREYSRANANRVAFVESDVELQEIMSAADVLVTDFSSAAEEFLIFDKPLVFANHLGENGYHETRGEWDEIFACGQVAMRAEDVAPAVENALGNPREYSQQRQSFRDRVFYKLDGNAAQRAADALRNLLNT